MTTWIEKLALFSSLFFFSFGIGLIADGKRLYKNELRLSERVDYRATLNSYSR